MTDYVPVIGLEIHAELTTQTKLFCRCLNSSHDLETPPNTTVCPVCLGLPGALPVLNKKAVAATMQLGRSLGSSIPSVTKWDRKNYFYPDLPKGYQISQYDQPLCEGGEVSWYDRQGQKHSVALTRVHLEEDTGKLTHPAGANYSLIDYNRSSIPLLELVTEPVMSSAEEAKQFAEEYQLRLRELEVAQASMEKGQMRCEANISVIPVEDANDPDKRLSGTKVEVKNLNSFRSLERAIEYEIKRQSSALTNGEALRQETRGWNEIKGETYVMRTKETADDYRYFPEPDLGELTLTVEVEEEGSAPGRHDLVAELLASGALSDYVFTVVQDPTGKRLHYIKQLITLDARPEIKQLAVQWLSNVSQLMEFEPKEVVDGLQRLCAEEVSASALKEALLSAEPGSLIAVLEANKTAEASHDIPATVAHVLGSFPSEVAAYKSGKERLLGFFVGQVRKTLQGQGNPVAIADELKRQLQ